VRACGVASEDGGVDAIGRVSTSRHAMTAPRLGTLEFFRPGWVNYIRMGKV
jgi:hypothetical protein